MLFTFQPLDWPSLIVVIVFLIPICVIDLRYFLIPDVLVFSGCLALLIYLLLFSEQRLVPAAVHGALAFAVMFAFWFVFKRQIGLGDAKLSFFLAAGLGFLEWWGALFLASLVAMTVGLIRVRRKKMTLKDKLPLAPFFGIGVIGVVLFKVLLLTLFP